MPLSDILIISSILVGLVSIPFLVTGPLSDSIPTGRLVLGMNSSDVEAVPSRMSKVFSSEKFEKTYETAFGRFTVKISAGQVIQELSKPGKVTSVNEGIDKTIWKIVTQQYQYEVTRTPDSLTQICTTPDGELQKVKQRGEVTESFQGMNQEGIVELCEQAEQDLQEEIEKMEQIIEESEIPSTETKSGVGGVRITEINVSAEWVRLENSGDSSVNMTGWALLNGREAGTGTYTYTFGVFTLAADEDTYVYSEDYGNSTLGYCDGNTTFCWTTTGRWDGARDVAILRDADGKEVDRCVYTGTDVGENDLVVCS